MDPIGLISVLKGLRYTPNSGHSFFSTEPIYRKVSSIYTGRSSYCIVNCQVLFRATGNGCLLADFPNFSCAETTGAFLVCFGCCRPGGGGVYSDVWLVIVGGRLHKTCAISRHLHQHTWLSTHRLNGVNSGNHAIRRSYIRLLIVRRIQPSKFDRK